MTCPILSRNPAPALSDAAMPLRAVMLAPTRPCIPMDDQGSPLARFTRKEWTLVALGLCAWLAIGAGGVWFAHQFTRPKAACGVAIEARSAQAGAATSPRNALQLLAGTGKCGS